MPCHAMYTEWGSTLPTTATAPLSPSHTPIHSANISATTDPGPLLPSPSLRRSKLCGPIMFSMPCGVFEKFAKLHVGAPLL